MVLLEGEVFSEFCLVLLPVFLPPIASSVNKVVAFEQVVCLLWTPTPIYVGGGRDSLTLNLVQERGEDSPGLSQLV